MERPNQYDQIGSGGGRGNANPNASQFRGHGNADKEKFWGHGNDNQRVGAVGGRGKSSSDRWVPKANRMGGSGVDARGNSCQSQFSGGKLKRGMNFGGDGLGRGSGGQGRSHGGSLQCGSQNSQLVIKQRTSELRSKVISIPESSKCLPIKRPDNGGTSTTRNLPLFVNHFPVGFNPLLTIFHYDVDIKLQEQTKKSKSLEMPKPAMCAIRDKFFSDHQAKLSLSKTAYDGEKNIFSAIELREGKFKVELPRGEGRNPQSYEFTIKLVNVLELHKLQKYLTGGLKQIPREILQGMDLVMKENPNRYWMSIGKGFYSKNGSKDVDIGGGLIAAKGFHHSLKPTSQGLILCIDYYVLPLRKPVPVKEFLEKNLHIDIAVTRKRTLAAWERRNIEEALRGLKVRVTHRRTNQQYTIEGLTRYLTKDLKFALDDAEGKSTSREVGLVQYFRDSYKKEIEYKYLPCLDFTKNKKINWVPLEFCELVEGQTCPKEKLDRDFAQNLKHECLVAPKKRMQVICDFVRERNGPCGGDVAENFEISVTKEMTQVIGRVIGPPDLKLGDSNGRSSKFTPDRDDCQWNLGNRSVLKGKRIDRWAVVDFTSIERNPHFRLQADRFIEHFMDRCNRLGMYTREPLFCQPSNMVILSDTVALRDLLKGITQRTRGRLQILICVMTRKHQGYKNLKRISETEIGLMTQCFLVNNANMVKDIHLGNLALKINAKLGGSNVELFDRLPHFKGDGHVMFIGADVNHPGSRNSSSPSIAAVVATVNWPAANKYVARISPQEHGKEEIVNFGEICLDLVNSYARLNNVRPEKIVVFRDGVGDDQFDMVLNKELQDLKNTIISNGYCPTITLVVSQKRHQTRLFPKNDADVPRNGNVYPGTVVDTKVVHPNDFDFYLCTHYGSLGTSKPTHYTVLYDDHAFTSDEMQRLIYNLCYTFARCTKPVSLVPPVYYADLVAYRGRLYHDAMTDSSPGSAMSSSSSSALSRSSSSSSTSSSSGFGFDSSFFKLHRDVENCMFFC